MVDACGEVVAEEAEAVVHVLLAAATYHHTRQVFTQLVFIRSVCPRAFARTISIGETTPPERELGFTSQLLERREPCGI